MTKALEIKDKIIKFCSSYETYLVMVVKFVMAFALFLTINHGIGFMSGISTTPVALILALVCCLLPVNVTLGIAAVLILLDMYSLAVETAIVTLILFVIIYFIYFRFAPKEGFAAVLTPITIQLHIPFVMPIGCGLLRNGLSVLGIVCSTVVYYYLDGIRQNESAFTSIVADQDSEMSSKFSIAIGQITGNKEMFLAVGVFFVACLVVYFVRRLSVEHAWAIAIVLGTIIQLCGIFVGSIMLKLSGQTLLWIIGGILSMLIGFMLEFFFMNLDYDRTERVQFEDDEYYYYVRAVPKRMVASEEKTVKHFGNTASMGKRIQKNKTGSSVPDENINRVIAQELDIDEDILN